MIGVKLQNGMTNERDPPTLTDRDCVIIYVIAVRRHLNGR